MLTIGHGWGITAAGTLAASTLVLPFERFAWISMVLVLPEHRRKGYATRLLRVAIADLEKRVSPRCSTPPRPGARSTGSKAFATPGASSATSWENGSPYPEAAPVALIGA